jgi:hypothetical protein
MYHYDPETALEELKEDALLPNPVHVRDMMIRAKLDPKRALEFTHKFQGYQEAFAEALSRARALLEALAG